MTDNLKQRTFGLTEARTANIGIAIGSDKAEKELNYFPIVDRKTVMEQMI